MGEEETFTDCIQTRIHNLQRTHTLTQCKQIPAHEFLHKFHQLPASKGVEGRVCGESEITHSSVKADQ